MTQKNQSNSPFFDLNSGNYTAIPNEILRNGAIPLPVKAVLFSIASRNPSYPTKAQIMADTGLSHTAVQNAINDLVAWNVVSKTQGSNFKKKANSYKALPRSTWQLPAFDGAKALSDAKTKLETQKGKKHRGNMVAPNKTNYNITTIHRGNTVAPVETNTKASVASNSTQAIESPELMNITDNKINVPQGQYGCPSEGNEPSSGRLVTSVAELPEAVLKACHARLVDTTIWGPVSDAGLEQYHDAYRDVVGSSKFKKPVEAILRNNKAELLLAIEQVLIPMGELARIIKSVNQRQAV